MPKVRYLQSDFERRITEEEGHLLTLQGVLRVLGMKSQQVGKDWLEKEGVKGYQINGRLKYETHEVVKALERSKL